MRNACPVLLVVVALALILCGCERDHIEVTVAPRPDGSFTRTIRLWRTHSSRPGELLAPSAAVVETAKPHYKERLPDQGGVVRFQGTFREVPRDMALGEHANRGGYTMWASRLGQLAAYRERRPGRTDLHACYTDAAAALDLATEVAATMVRQELKGEKGADRLAAFIESDFRRDAKDILFYLAVGSVSQLPMDAEAESDHDRTFGLLAFALQLAEERGYLKVKDVLGLLGGDDQRRKEALLSFVARKMGRELDDGLRTKLTALGSTWGDGPAFERALKSHGMTKEQFEKTASAIGNVVAFNIFNEDAGLRYVLVVPPGADRVLTNGRRRDEGRRIEWADEIDKRPVGRVPYALWTVPDAAWQTQHLGRVAVRDGELQAYVVWELSLSPDKLAAWLAAVDRLDPKGDLEAQLSAIHLTPPEPDAEPAPDAEPEPEEGARILIEALKPPQDD